jgi:N-acetylneuraminic acid mutarotase
LLQDGTVLVTGGVAGLDLLSTVERYDPGTNSFSAVAPRLDARAHHAQVVLPDGRVVALGGVDGAGAPRDSVEVYDPVADKWVRASPMIDERAHAEAVVVDARGRVMVVGGLGQATVQRTAEVWTPARDAWVPAPGLRDPRWDHTLVMAGGRPVVFGGARTPAGRAQDSVEVWDGSKWVVVGVMAEKRFGHTSVVLADGSVLTCGGVGPGAALDSTVVSSTCERYRVGAD